jgi:hypothetical protein
MRYLTWLPFKAQLSHFFVEILQDSYDFLARVSSEDRGAAEERRAYDTYSTIVQNVKSAADTRHQ